MITPVPVSVLIPARNEAAQIEACISSVSWADEIVVVDSQSTDTTVLLAERSGARVIQFYYRPGGPKKKNWALDNITFSNGWILILDADERVTPPLAREIARVIRESRQSHCGFYINRRFFFLGKWIRHAGYYPSWNLRLLRAGSGRYEPIPDMQGISGDNEVHEHILLAGSAGYLREPMDHYAFPTIHAFVEKHNRYSGWEASVGKRYLDPDWNAGCTAFHLKLRRALKRFARHLPFPDISRFVFHYFLKAGFLDGREGYLFCRLLAEYEFLIRAKSVEAAREYRQREEEAAPVPGRA